MKLKNQTCIVTGGGSGIGKGAAIALAAEGAHVVVADINKVNAESTVNEIQNNNGKASSVEVDVASSSSCNDMASAAIASTGRIDVLFHAAGVQFQQTSAVDTSDEEWARFIDTNLSGTFVKEYS